MLTIYQETASTSLLVVKEETGATDTQVANYMNGGHYNPHHDYVMKEKAPDHVSSQSQSDNCCFCCSVNLLFSFEDILSIQLIYILISISDDLYFDVHFS